MGCCKHLGILFVLLGAVVLPLLVEGAVENDGALLKRIEEMRKERDVVQDEIDRYVKKVQSLSSEISGLKKQREKSSSLITSYRLDKLLKEASSIAERLADLREQLKVKNKSLSELQDGYFRMLEGTIQQQRAKLKKEEIAEILSLSRASPVTEDPFKEDGQDVRDILRFRIDGRVSLSDLVDKRELLDNLHHVINSQVQAIDGLVQKVEQKRRVQESVMEFVEEVAFFEDEMMLRAKDSKKDNESGEKKDSEGGGEKAKSGARGPADKESPSQGGGTPPSNGGGEPNPPKPNPGGTPSTPNPGTPQEQPGQKPQPPSQPDRPSQQKHEVDDKAGVKPADVARPDDVQRTAGFRVTELRGAYSDPLGADKLANKVGERPFLSDSAVEKLKKKRELLFKQAILVKEKLDKVNDELLKRIKSGE